MYAYVCMYYTLNKALEYSVLEKNPAEQIAIELRHPRHDLLQEAARFIDNNCSIEIDNSVARDTDPSATTPTLREVSAALFTLVVGDGSRRPTLHMHRHSGLAQTSLLTPQQSSRLSVAEQMRDCMQQLSALLREYEVGMADAVFVHLYLSNISYFAAVNEEYCKWFGRHPPSRSCIAVNINYQNTIFIYLYYGNNWKHAFEKDSNVGRKRYCSRRLCIQEFLSIYLRPGYATPKSKEYEKWFMKWSEIL